MLLCAQALIDEESLEKVLGGSRFRVGGGFKVDSKKTYSYFKRGNGVLIMIHISPIYQDYFLSPPPSKCGSRALE